MDRGSNESGRVWNILWQRESTLSPFTYQKVLCLYLRLVHQDDRTESELTTAGIHGGSGALTVDHLCEKGTGDEHSTQ
ncbi:hypothetical protein T06_15698 [Trichinella sp. T6]|nr:hypothetical protein T06_15698 [Trichinella sp. T6]